MQESVTREIYDVFYHFNTHVVGIQPTGQSVTKTSLAKFGLKVSIEPGHALTVVLSSLYICIFYILSTERVYTMAC